MVWLLTIPVLAAVSSNPNLNLHPGSLEKTYFSHPDDGKNGLQLLLKAFDLAQADDGIRRLADNSAPRMTDLATKASLSSLEKVLNLQARSLAVPFDLSPINRIGIRKGGFFAPSDFPVWAVAKEIAKATAHASDAAFSARDPNWATKNLLLQIQVSHKTLGGSPISMLVSIAIDSIAYGAFQAHLTDLNDQDLQEIIRAPILPPTSEIKQAIENEGQLVASNAEAAVRSVAKFRQTPTEQDEKGWFNYYRGLSPKAKIGYPAAVSALCRSTYREITIMLDKTERDWPYRGIPLSPAARKDPIARTLLSISIDAIPQMLVAIAKSRTQARLMILHAEIQRFHLANGRLPKTLAEMGLPKSETFDPLSGQGFSYTPGSPYHLSSLGIKETGPIQLRRGRNP